MKFKRSERLVDMTNYLLEHPRELISLTFFSSRYQSAKSSISEDLGIIKETFEAQGIGTLQTVAGASGGVYFHIAVSEEAAKSFVKQLCERMEDVKRLLPGGYLFMTDLLGDPKVVDQVGKIFASKYANKKVDAVMTVATKGIPLAYSVAKYLNVPVVILRPDSKVTEGSTVNINYVSGSSKRIQTMVLSKRSLEEGSHVLIVDDFMKAGGTINGMASMLKEFNSYLAGICVFVEGEQTENRLVKEYHSLIKLKFVDETNQQIKLSEGNYFES